MSVKIRPDVTIALLTWNRRKYLEKGLPAMFSALSKELKHEILIMDNASTDGTVELIRKYESHPEVVFIPNRNNICFKGYRQLFNFAKGRIIIELDDDVIEFPKNFDKTLLEYLDAYKDYGFIALDVEANELTDGGVVHSGNFDRRGDMVVEELGARGYCAAFRRRDYRIIRPLTYFFPFSLRHPQDWVVSGLMRRLLKRRTGIVFGVKCLHANGPLYAEKFGRISLDMAKMLDNGCPDRAKEYQKALSNRTPYSP